MDIFLIINRINETILYLNLSIFIRSSCIQCQTPLYKNGKDEFKCYACPVGATCFDGVLFNDAGFYTNISN